MYDVVPSVATETDTVTIAPVGTTGFTYYFPTISTTASQSSGVIVSTVWVIDIVKTPISPPASSSTTASTVSVEGICDPAPCGPISSTTTSYISTGPADYTPAGATTSLGRAAKAYSDTAGQSTGVTMVLMALVMWTNFIHFV
jgi:hypothetical protein